MKMGNAFNLGRLFGIQIRLHYTWFIIFMLVTVSLVYPDWSQWLSWVIGIVTSLLFFASVLAHELAHSLVGRISGVTIKSITLFIFGGVAQMTREATSAVAELRMAAAGPACSLAIGGLFGLVWFLTQASIESVATMALRLALVNVLLAAFNLIPGFPLDGGRVFRSILWRATGNYGRSTRIATRVGRGVAYLFILSGIMIVFLRPFGLSWFDGIWIAFIGWFLDNAASASYRQAQWREALQGFTAADVMTSDFPVVPSDMTVSQLIQRHVFPSGHHFFVVADGDRLQGILTLYNIKSVPQQHWDLTQVKGIMTPASKLKIAYPNQDALSLMEQMDESDINQMPVVSEGRVVGLVARDNLFRFLRTRSELRV
jgi:Zn-dependent protease